MDCVYDGPDSTGGALRSLGASDNGTTIEVKVGSVLVVGTPQGPVRSSNPEDLGLLLNGPTFPIENDDYRAWHTGHADLFAPGWTVHINIT